MPGTPLIAAAELLARLGQVVVVDCRFSLADPELGASQYRAGHIPGAHYCHLERDLSAPPAATGGRHPLPDPANFCEAMAARGISTDTPVVAYDDSRLAFASRLWWMLTALGYSRVQVLDGGWSAWQAAGGAVTTLTPDPQPVEVHRAATYAGIVDFADIGAVQAGGAQLIDAREPARYRGETEPIDPVAGHIPGALNYPWQDTTDTAGKALTGPAQRERWRALEASGELVVYCGSGVTACVNILSLALAGRTDVRLYPGSWSDWCARLPGD